MTTKPFSIKNFILVLIIGSVIIYSCTSKKEPECGDPRAYYVQINLVDTNGNSIIGIGKRFNPDSVYFLINSNKWSIQFENGSLIWSYSDKDKFNVSNYLLHLSYNVIDTIRMNVNRHSNNCWDNFSMQKFEYNKAVIDPTTGGQFDYSYKIIKN